MNTLTVGGGCTVTLRVAVAVRPPPSCTVSVSVWAPGARPEVSQLNEAVGPVFEVEKIDAAPPSSRSVQLMVPVPLLSLIPTVTVPPTVAPSVGLVIVAVSDGCCTVTRRVAVVELPEPSCTVAVSVCGPSATVAAVSQLKVNVPAGALLVKRTTVPGGGRRGSSTLTVNESVPPPLVETDALTTPPTVTPAAGVLNHTASGVGGGTVTLRVAVVVCPPPSCTVSVSVWEPGVTWDVSQVNEVVGPAFEVEKIGVEPPSSRSVHEKIGRASGRDRA